MKKIVLMFLLTMMAMLTLPAHAEDCYSDGVRVGTIQKFSKKGMLVKSWEGELVMDGIKMKAGAQGGTVWTFSVQDPQVAAVIDDAVMSGDSVALKYCQVIVSVITDTPYRVTKAVIRKSS